MPQQHDGLMQDWPLTVDKVIAHAARVHGERKIVTRRTDAQVYRTANAASLTSADLTELLDGKIARWWMPDDYVVVAAIPLGATGKVEKRALRATLDNWRQPA